MTPFGPWEPDKQETAPGISMEALNVLPLAQGYGPSAGLSVSSGAEALSGAPRGLEAVVLRDGSYKVYGLTESKLEELQSDDTWSDIATGYSCTSGDDWTRDQFGNQLLFSNTTDGLKAYDLESGGTPAAISAAGAPREIFTCSNVVVGLDCLDNTAARDNRLIKTSAFGDHTNWTTNGADYQSLQDGAELICGRDLKNGAAIIFQRDSLRLMQFGNQGGGALFSLQKIANGRGAVGAKPVVAFDGVCYFLATNGFWQFSSEGLRPIGATKIDQWFFDRVDNSMLSSVQGSVDPYRKMVWWRWPSTSISSTEVFDDLLGYSWVYDAWVRASVQTTYLGRIASPGLTLATLDSTYGALSDIPDVGLGDRLFQGGQPVFAALNSARKFATVAGPNLAAKLESSTLTSPTSGLVSSVTPHTDADNATIQVGVKDALKDSLTWGAATGIQTSGRVPVRARGKNIRFRQNVAAGELWEYAKGVDAIEASRGGAR